MKELQSLRNYFGPTMSNKDDVKKNCSEEAKKKKSGINLNLTVATVSKMAAKIA